MKKYLVFLSLSTTLFLLAGQALAAAYMQPIMATSTGNFETTNPQLLNSQQLQAYMGQMGQGRLSPQDQMAFYQLMHSLGYSTGAPMMGNFSYSRMSGLPAFSMMSGNANGLTPWFSLMSIITTVLVWVALLLLIAVLWHWLKKHKTHS